MSEHHGPTGNGVVTPDSPQFEVAARNEGRAEKLVAASFVLAVLSFAAFGGAYWQDAPTYVLGGTLGFGFVCFGYGFAAWGKYLMPRGPFEEPRPLMATTRAEREAVIGDFTSRGKVAIHRRGFLLKLLGLAGGVFGVVALFPLLRSLGPLPKKAQYTTKWRRGSYVTTIEGTRVRAGDVGIGAFATVFPEDDVGSAVSQTLLIHVQETDLVTKPGRETWGPQGYVAFSKVCTHAGCPVGLYEQLTKQLLCPCHQSLFDVTTGCTPIFGPAPRPLAQLPLYVDSDGYLRAQADYDEPIGPGFWSRGGTE